MAAAGHARASRCSACGPTASRCRRCRLSRAARSRCCASPLLALLLWLLGAAGARAARAPAARTWWCCSIARAAWSCPRAPGGEARAADADRARRIAPARAARARRGRSAVVLGSPGGRGAATRAAGSATALGDALDELSGSDAMRRASAVVVVSDGAVNAGRRSGRRGAGARPAGAHGPRRRPSRARIAP